MRDADLISGGKLDMLSSSSSSSESSVSPPYAPPSSSSTYSSCSLFGLAKTEKRDGTLKSV